MDHNRANNRQRQRRTWRVRKSTRGSSGRPRLTIFRSHKHIYAQVVDDSCGKTLVSASTRDKDIQGKLKYCGNTDAAVAIGKLLAQRATEAGVQQVCFDRGPFKYHGRLAALADAAREAGLSF